MARVLTGMGFNVCMMDLKLPKVKAAVVFKDNKEKINHLVENCLLWEGSGGFFLSKRLFPIIYITLLNSIALSNQLTIVVTLCIGTDSVATMVIAHLT